MNAEEGQLKRGCRDKKSEKETPNKRGNNWRCLEVCEQIETINRLRQLIDSSTGGGGGTSTNGEKEGESLEGNITVKAEAKKQKKGNGKRGQQYARELGGLVRAGARQKGHGRPRDHGQSTRGKGLGTVCVKVSYR